jgi:hypothetical protein
VRADAVITAEIVRPDPSSLLPDAILFSPCLSAYQRRLDGLTMIKIRTLELPGALPS